MIHSLRSGNKLRSLRTYLLLPGLLLGAAGCTTIATERYEGFAETARELLTNAQDTDHRVHLIHQRYRVTSAADDALTTNSFQVVSGETDAALVEALGIRTAALDVLLTYADLVGAMSDRRRWREIGPLALELEPTIERFEIVAGIGEAGATTTLTTATAQAQREVPRERPGKIRDALAGVVFITKRTIGTQLGPQTTRILAATAGSVMAYRVSTRRMARLLEIMQQSQGDVERLSSIIAQGNESIRTATDRMVEQIVDRSNAVRPPFDTPARIAFDSDIAALLEEKSTINDSLDSVATTMQNLPAAHTELIALLEKKPTKKQALHNLRKEAERIEKDYRPR